MTESPPSELSRMTIGADVARWIAVNPERDMDEVVTDGPGTSDSSARGHGGVQLLEDMPEVVPRRAEGTGKSACG